MISGTYINKKISRLAKINLLSPSTDNYAGKWFPSATAFPEGFDMNPIKGILGCVVLQDTDPS